MGDPKLKTTSPEIILVCILHFWLHLVVSKESDLWRDSIWGGALRREGAKKKFGHLAEKADFN